MCCMSKVLMSTSIMDILCKLKKYIDYFSGNHKGEIQINSNVCSVQCEIVCVQLRFDLWLVKANYYKISQFDLRGTGLGLIL